MNQSRCDQNNNKAGSALHIPIHTRRHAGGARTRPAARSFMSSPATPTHLPKVGARCTCVLRMQLGHQPGPGSSQGLFLPLLCRGTRGCEGRAAIRRGAAPVPRSSRTMSRTRRLRLLGDPVQPGWGRGIPPQGNIAPRSLRPTRASLPPAKRWDEEDLTGIRTCPRTMSMRVCPPHRSTHPCIPRASSPTAWERSSLERNKSQRHDYFFPAINGSVIHLGSRIIKAGMLSSWIHRISATPSPLFPTGFITLQLPSFIPLSLPGWGFVVQPAQRWEGLPAPDVQRYLSEYQ